MKGFVARTVTAVLLAGGIGMLTGCYGYRDLVDPCYPWRYNWQAQQSVCALRGAQINNGHVLDQTLWNWHFEDGKDTLTRGGMEKLDYLARRRPHPDPCLYLATAHDVRYNQDAEADAFSKGREELNSARIQAIQKYLAAHTAGRGVAFQVYVHDPAAPYLPGGAGSGTTGGVQKSMSDYLKGFQGSRTAGGGGGAAAPTN